MSLIRTARFGKGATILRNYDPRQPLALDAIARGAPSVFAEGAHESRSDRYAYIPTRSILAGLIKNGFEPFEVRQGGSADAQKRGFTKHMVRLRHASTPLVEVRGGDMIAPEIVLLNSHDGTSSYQLSAGAFRFICTNGLMAGDVFEHVRVKHTGDALDNVIEGAFRVVEQMPLLVDQSREMAGTNLSRFEQQAFARAALELRWEPDTTTGLERATAPIAADQLLAPNRRADAAADLWTTMNVVQEGIIRGGQSFVVRDAHGRPKGRRTVRPVNGIDQNRALNRALWTLAEALREHKAAA